MNRAAKFASLVVPAIFFTTLANAQTIIAHTSGNEEIIASTGSSVCLDSSFRNLNPLLQSPLQRIAREVDVPDGPPRAFRTSGSNPITFLSGNWGRSYAWRLPNFSTDAFLAQGSDGRLMNKQCGSPGTGIPDRYLLNPESSCDYNQFAWRQWLWSTWKFPDNRVFGLLHNEYHGDEVGQICPNHPLSSSRWTNTITWTLSSDEGRFFSYRPPVEQRAVMRTQAGPLLNGAQSGFREPTNIVQSPLDNKFYMMVLAVQAAVPGGAGYGTCMVRTPDLLDVTAYRAWDGQGWNARLNLGEPCTPVIAGNGNESIGHTIGSMVYVPEYESFVAVGMAEGAQGKGFYLYSASARSPQSWSQGSLISSKNFWNATQFPWQVYPSLIDPNSQRDNFDFSSRTPYLYFVSILDNGYISREIHRVPIQLERPDDIIKNAYQEILGRYSVSQSELQNSRDLLNTLGVQGFRNRIAQSDEALSNLLFEVLGRFGAPDASTASYWRGRINAVGFDQARVEASLNDEAVTNLYRNVLQRPGGATPAEIDYWKTRISQVGFNQARNEIAQTNESISNTFVTMLEVTPSLDEIAAQKARIISVGYIAAWQEVAVSDKAISYLYRFILGRFQGADQAALTYWRSRIAQIGYTRTVQELAVTNEAVGNMFAKILGRLQPPNAAEQDYWKARIGAIGYEQACDKMGLNAEAINYLYQFLLGRPRGATANEIELTRGRIKALGYFGALHEQALGPEAISTLFRDILGRFQGATDSEITYWNSFISVNRYARTRQALGRTNEAVSNLYKTLLGRPQGASSAEINYWQSQADLNGYDWTYNEIGRTAEGISNLFRTILGRINGANAAEISYWVNVAQVNGYKFTRRELGRGGESVSYLYSSLLGRAQGANSEERDYWGSVATTNGYAYMRNELGLTNEAMSNSCKVVLGRSQGCSAAELAPWKEYGLIIGFDRLREELGRSAEAISYIFRYVLGRTQVASPADIENYRQYVLSIGYKQAREEYGKSDESIRYLLKTFASNSVPTADQIGAVRNQISAVGYDNVRRSMGGQ